MASHFDRPGIRYRLTAHSLRTLTVVRAWALLELAFYDDPTLLTGAQRLMQPIELVGDRIPSLGSAHRFVSHGGGLIWLQITRSVMGLRIVRSALSLVFRIIRRPDLEPMAERTRAVQDHRIARALQDDLRADRVCVRSSENLHPRPFLPISARDRERVAYHTAYGVFFAMCLLKSGAPSRHQTGPRSPKARLAWSTLRCAAASASRSATRLASRTARRAAMRWPTSSAFRSAGIAGSPSRQRRPRNTK